MRKKQGGKECKASVGKMPERIPAEKASTGADKDHQHLEADRSRLSITTVSRYDPTKLTGSPWLTVYIDPASRAVVGGSISLDDAS